MTAYNLVYRKCPSVRYMGNQWYQVNSEVVHRSDLINETARLKGLARQQRAQFADKGVVARLIAKLRGL